MSYPKELIKQMPYLRRVVNRMRLLEAELDHVKNELAQTAEVLSQQQNENEELKKYKTAFPAGHFYSPYPDLKYLKRNEAKLFSKRTPNGLPGIDLNEKSQLALLDEFAKYYDEMPFKAPKQKGLRYWFENDAYQYSDAICLYSMIRYLKPRKFIEVGSGYSSAATLDTNELFFDNKIVCTFIEPYPALLKSLLKKEDKKRIKIIPKRVQDVEMSEFESLSAGDILFIDSTHVSKIDSDVNFLIFEVLPRLASGVAVHFHDVIYPFQYWPEITYSGIAWQEAYLLRAFMQYNDSFEILFYNTYLEDLYPEKFEQKLPLCLKHVGGSLWIRKK